MRSGRVRPSDEAVEGAIEGAVEGAIEDSPPFRRRRPERRRLHAPYNAHSSIPLREQLFDVVEQVRENLGPHTSIHVVFPETLRLHRDVHRTPPPPDTHPGVPGVPGVPGGHPWARSTDAFFDDAMMVQMTTAYGDEAPPPPFTPPPPPEEPLDPVVITDATRTFIEKTCPSLKCPITQEVFRRPVVAADGHTYEREELTRWLRGHSTSPLTGRTMGYAAAEWLWDNHAIRKLMLDLDAALKDPTQVIDAMCSAA